MIDNLTRIERFRADGYFALRGFLNPEQVGDLRENVRRFIETIAPKMPAGEVFYEDKSAPSTLKQIQRMFAYDEYFERLMHESPFEALAAELLDHEVRGVNMQYFNKPPGVGRPTPAHQDGYYFMLAPNEAVTMWLALEDVDEETGCVRYVRGSHDDGLRPHGQTETLGFSQGLSDYGPRDSAREIAFPAQPGDLLAHHALTIHRADANRSTNRSRQAIGFIYYSTAAKESDEKQERAAALLHRLQSEGKV
jgi:phytanoyl-CoA hydroxylase